MSLVVLAGYADGIAMDCADHHDGGAEHQDSAAGPAQDCHCVCHVPTVHPATVPVLAIGAILATGSITTADEFPPDAVPLGIEYPPQLA